MQSLGSTLKYTVWSSTHVIGAFIISISRSICWAETILLSFSSVIDSMAFSQ